MQIAQFVIDLVLVYFGSTSLIFLAPFQPLLNIPIAYQHTAATYFADTLPHVGNCAGSETAASFGCALLTSYLGLFINFYFQTYKKPTAVSKPTANGKTNG